MEIQNVYYFRSCRGWIFFFFTNGVLRAATADRVIKEWIGYIVLYKGPWELDHLCGLPRAMFTLQQHPGGFLFTPENPQNRNLGARRHRHHRIYIYLSSPGQKPSINRTTLFYFQDIYWVSEYYIRRSKSLDNVNNRKSYFLVTLSYCWY